MSEWGQGLTFTKNVVRGFLFYSTPPAQRTVYQPQQVKVSSRGVVSSKKAIHKPGLSPDEGQKFDLETRTGSRDNSRACLWVCPRSRQLAQCWLINHWLSFVLMTRLETPKTGSGPRNPRAESMSLYRLHCPRRLVFWCFMNLHSLRKLQRIEKWQNSFPSADNATQYVLTYWGASVQDHLSHSYHWICWSARTVQRIWLKFCSGGFYWN